MTATMTMTMCFDEQIPQGEIHDYFDTSKVYFSMPASINANIQTEFAPSQFWSLLSVY